MTFLVRYHWPYLRAKRPPPFSGVSTGILFAVTSPRGRSACGYLLLVLWELFTWAGALTGCNLCVWLYGGCHTAALQCNDIVLWQCQSRQGRPLHVRWSRRRYLSQRHYIAKRAPWCVAGEDGINQSNLHSHGHWASSPWPWKLCFMRLNQWWIPALWPLLEIIENSISPYSFLIGCCPFMSVNHWWVWSNFLPSWHRRETPGSQKRDCWLVLGNWYSFCATCLPVSNRLSRMRSMLNQLCWWGRMTTQYFNGPWVSFNSYSQERIVWWGPSCRILPVDPVWDPFNTSMIWNPLTHLPLVTHVRIRQLSLLMALCRRMLNSRSWFRECERNSKGRVLSL